MRTDSYASSMQSSDDSDHLSDDTFLNKIGSEWGEEESELRQAIFFQFTKPNARYSNDSLADTDKISQYDRLLDRDSIISGTSGGGRDKGSTFRLRPDNQRSGALPAPEDARLSENNINHS